MRSRDATRISSDYKSNAERENVEGLVGNMIKAKANLGLGLKKPIKSKWTDQLAEELHKPVTRKFLRRRV